MKASQQNTASRKVIDYRKDSIVFVKEKSAERLSINATSETIVEHKKTRIFEKLF
jgi:hypothetical protein